MALLIKYSIQDHLLAGWIEEDNDLGSGKLKNKFRKLFKDPYGFFADSSIFLIRPIKRLFKNSKLGIK